MARMNVSKNRKWLTLIASAFVVVLFFSTVLANGQPPFPEPTSMTVTATPQLIPINGSTATIAATVYDQYDEPMGGRLYFNNSETNLGFLPAEAYQCFNDTGECVWISWINETTGVATMTLTSGMVAGTERVRVWVPGHKGNPALDKTVTVNFTAEDEAPPSVTNPSATSDVILNDNGRARAAGTDVSQLNVTVTDDAGVASVSIDLSPIGGSATQAMTLIQGTNTNGIWTVTTNASAGINATHALFVNATDLYGKINTTVSVPLTVLRRGDVVRDNVTDMKDVLYIARYTVGFEPEASNPPSIFVGDVVGEAGDPAGDGKVDMKDALFIARRVAGLEEEP
jgi:hypothetical protein